jgi:hypothetical protein
VKRQTLIISATIVIAVLLATVGIYVATHGSGTTITNPTTTPKPTETATTSPNVSETPSPTSTSTTTSVAAASSLHFQVSVTNSLGLLQDVYEYQVKNIGKSNLMLRVEMSPAGGSNSTYIVNGALQKAWIWADGQWTDMSSSFTSQWSTWKGTFEGYKNSLTHWIGSGDYKYTAANGDSIRIYDITINPLLQDQSFTI